MMPLAFLALAAAQPTLVPAQMPQAGSAMRKYPGVSDAGNAMLAEALAAPDPALTGLMRQQRGIRDALTSAAMAPTVNVDQVATLLKQREDLQSQYRQRLDDKLVAALRQLPMADRGAFLRALVTPAGPGMGGPGGGMPPLGGQQPMPPR